MSIHTPKKQSPILSENKPRKTRTIDNSILSKRRNNNEIRSNLYHFNETKNKIIQQLPNLFIPEEKLSNYTSQISKLSIDNSNFLQVWNNISDSISKYLSDPFALRCSIYINEQIEQCRKQINDIYNRLNSDHKQINKKILMTYKNIQNDLDNLYSKMNQAGNGKLRIISESSNLFDRFTNSLSSNYLPFFQCISSDQKTINFFIKSALKPINNIINCSNSILNLEEIQQNFITQINHTTAIFVKIYNSKYPSLKKNQRNSHIPILSNSLKQENSTSSTSKIPKSKKRSNSLSSPLSQKTLGRYNANHIEKKNEGSNIKPNLRRRKSENSIISLPDFSHKKFLPKIDQNGKNNNYSNSKKSSKSDDEEDQKNSLDTHMHNDDMYQISNGKLSESDNETTNVPIKPKTFKISQTRYDQLNKKFNKTQNNDLLRKSSKNQTNLNMNLNTNLNSVNSFGSQIRSKNNEEARMMKTLDILNHKNDRLKEQHKTLKQKIEKDQYLTQINGLKNEIDHLRSNLNDSNYDSDELRVNVEYMRDLIAIVTSSIQSLDEECEQALRIKNGIEAEDETASFDNPNLRRSCESLKIKLDRLQSQINENRNKREIMIKVIETANNNFSEDDRKSDTQENVPTKPNLNNSSYINKSYLKQKKIQQKPKFHSQKLKQKQTRIPVLQKTNNNNIINNNFNNNSNNSSFNSFNSEGDFSISNEELHDAFFKLQMNSQMTARGNKHLSLLYEQMCVLPNPIEQKSASSFFNVIEFNGKKQLSKNVEKLEENVKKVRQSSTFSSLYSIFYSMKSNTVRMKEEIVEIELKNKRLINQISRLSLIQSKNSNKKDTNENESESGNCKRKSFDIYEQLKEKSRDLLIKYFAVQKNYSNDLDTAARYKIDMQLDDIQEQYTNVMMEIDRIGNTKVQEKLHAKRKIKIRGRKEIPKLLEVLEQASKFNLEAENKGAALEKKVSSTFSILTKTVQINRNKNNFDNDESESESEDDTDYLLRHQIDNDEDSVTKLAEVIIECRKVSEILALIKDKSNQFFNCINKNNDPTKSDENKGLNDLLTAVKSLIKKGGSVAQTKLQIINLKKEIESYSMLE